MSNDLTANDSIFHTGDTDSKSFGRSAHECVMPPHEAPVETVIQTPPRVAFKGSRAEKKITAALVKELDGGLYARTTVKPQKSKLSVASGVAFAMVSPIPSAPGVAMMMIAQGLKTPNVEMTFNVDLEHKGLLSLLPELKVRMDEGETAAKRNPVNPGNENHKQPANPLSIRGQNRTLRTMHGKDEMRRSAAFIPDPDSKSFTDRLQQQAADAKRGIV